MTQTPKNEAELVHTMALIRAQREELESALAKCRRQSRALALEALFVHHWSLKRTERLTGHMRTTLRTWVAVAQADGLELTPEQAREQAS